ncbi:mitochondrial inner membrane protease subunit 2 [Pseudomassariella vexata]|uniref:Mitochondrial inner membrane protease subunit 2 n=1 Tax=Pseudomassariella vexata TaxID=1141098 RepID=A0A1Y2E3P7_9PEZI|nr:mitochondrial inner membrane protease subunit 2 [Pseudomassariella vexata]ORY65495.1 mitochondrial inner membrane protease subunit 2 [Pseudomassariella vexata]
MANHSLWARLRPFRRPLLFNKVALRIQSHPRIHSVNSRWTRYKSFRQHRFLGDFTWYSWIFLTWVPVVVFFNANVMELAFINGPSMYPFMNAEKDQTTAPDVTVAWKWNAQHNLARGMIVLFWNPRKPEITVVKRVVGLEGDIITTRPPYPALVIRVPPGHIWVEGDGGERDSIDSNVYGPIATALVIGTIPFVLKPLHRAGWVRWWEHPVNGRVRHRS